MRVNIEFTKPMFVVIRFIFGSNVTAAAVEKATIERNHSSNPTHRLGSTLFRTSFNDEKHRLALWKHELVL